MTLFGSASEFKKLLQLKHVIPNWEASGAAPPNHTAIATAGRVLEKLAILDFRPDRIDPSTGEGVSLSFRRGNKSADLECFNTGEILALEAIDGGNPVIWEVSEADIESAAARINRFIFG